MAVYQNNVKAPELNFKDRDAYTASIDQYFKDTKADLIKAGYNEADTGKVIRFPVADGYAEYMVASSNGKGVLIHMEHMDAYSFQYADLLTGKEIKEEIATAKAWEKLFK